MRKSEIVIGAEYLTKVSGALVMVKATGWRKPDGLFHKRERVCIERVDNRRALDPRDPSALRAISERGPRPDVEPVQPFEQAQGKPW